MSGGELTECQWGRGKTGCCPLESGPKEKADHGRPCPLHTGTCHGCLPSTSTRTESGAAAAADFQHPLKAVQGGEQKRGTLSSGRKGL